MKRSATANRTNRTSSLPTMLEVLLQRTENLGKSTESFLKNECGLVPMNREGLITWKTHYWTDLTATGKQSQPALLTDFRRFGDLLKVLSQELPSEPKRKLTEHLETWEDVIDQGERTGYKTIDEAVLDIQSMTADIGKMLSEYSPSGTDTACIFADTNALLFNPAIENWRFVEFAKFKLVLTPSVLAELDDHKINHKNPDVREKSLKLINQMKDYLRRGNIHEGVPINSVVSLAMIATEPKMEKSLPWFDHTNSDDRCLASIIEIMRSKLGSPMFVVTSDINMINKATFAGIPLMEVPLVV